MKTIQNIQTLLLLLVLSVVVSFSYGQGNTFKLDGNNNIAPNSFLGSTNLADLIFKTNNSTRMTITKDGLVSFLGKVTIGDTLQVANIIAGTLTLQSKLTIDSMKVNNYMDIDSIHARVIRVGNNSLLLGGVQPVGGNDQITSSNPA